MNYSNHRRHFNQVLVSTLGASLVPFPAQAQTIAADGTVEIAGVKFPAEHTYQNTKLKLNGFGVRFRVIFQVYAMALYTERSATSGAEILDAKTTKYAKLHMLREVSGNDMGKLFARGIQDNAGREQFLSSYADLAKVGEIFAQQRSLKRGDSLAFGIHPKLGTQLFVREKEAGAVFNNPIFGSMLASIWFGNKPADDALKLALLGGKSTANTSIN
jgi:hypothetical protein